MIPKARHRPVQVPTILQMEATECGAACLAMVLAYHGRWVPLETLREACGVSRDGSKASNLLKAARRFGLAAKGFRKEPDTLHDLPVPSIIHWNFNHYVVFRGIKGDRVHLNDPASGPRVISRQELDESFTGVVIALERGEDFAPGGTPPRPFAQLADSLRGSRPALALVALLSLFLVLPGIVIPGLTSQFIDMVLVQQMESWVMPLVLGLLLATLLQGGVTALQQHYLLRLEAKLAVTLAGRYLSRLMTLPMRFFTQRHAGELANRVAATDRVATLLSGELATNLFNAMSLVFYLAVIAFFDPVMAAAAAVLGGCNALALVFAARKRDDLNRQLLGQQGKLLSATVGSIHNIETLKATGGESDAFALWSGHQAGLLTTRQEIGVQSALLSVIPALTTALAPVAVLGIGGYRVMEGVLTIGALVAVQTLFQNFMGPLAGLTQLGARLQLIKGDIARLSDVLSTPPPPSAEMEEQDPAFSAPPQGRVELRSVSFGYSPLDEPLIANFSLTLEPGKRIALVGGSGSGKSTIGRLVSGLLQPWEGEILIDGIPLAELSPARFVATIAHVDQDIMLFEGTVRDNLTLWAKDVPDEVLTRALKDAEIHAEVASRPGGYDGMIREGGLNFSGGQRQRLEIARALVNDPAVIVLDEATSALDPVTEHAIDSNLRRRGCACLIVAHRLSTIRDADEILVMEHGTVVERGTHEDLMARNGRYADLIRSA
ncbi:NHLP family bacteriocin export ABC transporter peptidase/permease/ATPase subunit [Telmatospirillum sp. J64-1]|uniref:NHLP family bacteriocin export ABC transporter peptidase/permease/ATPase subunit n=1 Tax=Telmatospirillum sp. J64-1 TaxID=2502183 RepID=UPI00115D2272|nr:NHLP family bacteriocin export ABC transporter peptidase/permease/ATPase subunit [Telmatospirillum sp. J64-1]